MTINNQDEREALIAALWDGLYNPDGKYPIDQGHPEEREAVEGQADIVLAHFHRTPVTPSVEDVVAWDALGEKLLQDWRDAQKDGQLTFDIEQGFGYAWDLAQQHHASTSPTVVTTVEELEALPDDVTIKFAGGNVASRGLDGLWYLAGSRGGYTSEQIGEHRWLPATVLTSTSPPPSEVRVTGEQAMGAWGLTDDERMRISAVVHANYYMPDVFTVVADIIKNRGSL